MRQPNGYGAVVKLTGARRKPYAVRITQSYAVDEDGVKRQHYQYLGYYETQSKANISLARYNENPYTAEVSTITFADVYERWKVEKFEDVSYSTIKGYEASFKNSKPLWDMKFVDIRKQDMQDIINSRKQYANNRKNKILFNQLFRYALENDIVQKDYAKFVTVGKNEKPSTKEPFSDNEIKTLWDNVDRYDYIDTVLIMIYTGLRPGELITIRNADVNLAERYMRGGIKTTAGKNRVIPINKKILPLIEKRLSAGEFLVTTADGKPMQYINFSRTYWHPAMKQIGMEHLPHECRHTFATLMNNAGANKVSIQRIMGHASKDITDQVYTHKDISELLKAIDLI